MIVKSECAKGRKIFHFLLVSSATGNLWWRRVLGLGLAAGGAGDAVLGSQRCERGWRIAVDGELLERL